ncbi:MAG: bifunctional phosphoribosylaminoimidazolecarboxamide formyltransferase/IMP cyclohydrolase [Deltaproteobacteria bacterium]|nr:bifunctional phosphoribosylaminoimidazolecarboxamide formyltransferase/IMP cyclohydrolase [Deltaproteobacteria bacterium]
MLKVTRALVSVSNKEGVVELGRGLAALGIEILSTGGTAKTLAEAGVPVTKVSAATGFPEILGGRVKTLHPKIHGGILGRPGLESDRAEMEREGITPIGIVAVNLYPFEATIAKAGVTRDEAVEQIDIGGPAMVRASAKNHAWVGIVVDPSDYAVVLDELRSGGGVLTEPTRQRLAGKAFAHTAAYDSAIAAYLAREESGDAKALPGRAIFALEKVQDLRYGENPHQRAALYRSGPALAGTLVAAKQLQGKELSFNNLLDLEAALRIARDLADPGAVVIKHNNPCGVARHASSLAQAYRDARATDPDSAFGGVVGLNRPVDAETAAEIGSTFIEAVIAPSFSEEARAALAKKTNLRLLELPFESAAAAGFDVKPVSGGFLIQDADAGTLAQCTPKVVTKRAPTDAEWEALRFAWIVVKHVKSNAIVYANANQTVGIGAGQMSRVDSSRIAVSKAKLPLVGTVLASDAFFPFRDGVDAAAKAGAVAVIQPGGSVRDEEVIAAADEQGMAMVFTGMRHFKH